MADRAADFHRRTVAVTGPSPIRHAWGLEIPGVCCSARFCPQKVFPAGAGFSAPAVLRQFDRNAPRQNRQPLDIVAIMTRSSQPPRRGLPGPVLALVYIVALVLPLLLALLSGRAPQPPWPEAAS
ncbi:MAG: hypothetical protein KDJ77_14320, partial [Rhodobiaceae bacterium]|nr:hypothetical protein [Rhodobiaceae bacterium]